MRVSHLVALALVLFTPSVSLRLPASSVMKAIDAPSLRELSVRTEGVSAVGLAPPSEVEVKF